jgi:hypothetical protein
MLPLGVVVERGVEGFKGGDDFGGGFAFEGCDGVVGDGVIAKKFDKQTF